jgi:hypothetical protein
MSEQIGLPTNENEKHPEVAQEIIDTKLSRIDFEALRKRLSEDSVFLKVEAILRALATLVIKLEPTLPNYTALLSDETSGRTITLILRKLANQIRAQTKRPPVDTYFLVGGYHRAENHDDSIRNFLVQNNLDKKGKVLLVTESIQSGLSVLNFIRMFKQLGIDFEVATVSLAPGVENGQIVPPANWILEPDLQGEIDKIYYGEAGNDSAGRHLHRIAGSGVAKGYNNLSPHPVPLISDNYKKKVISTREDINVIVEEFSKLLG